MPIKTAFNKSLLNCQPILTSSAKVVSTLYDKDDGYSGVDIGFAGLIEKQQQQKSNSDDSISLVGISDFVGSQNFSIDPQRPEIILLSKLFAGNYESQKDYLKLKNFEASLDEADIKTIFDIIFSNENITKQIEKRIESDVQNREQISKILESISKISLNINNFRDSTNFIGSNLKIHSTAASQRSKLKQRFSEDPVGSLMGLKRTFLGLNEDSLISNTSIIQLLMISLLLPGAVKFSSPNTATQGSKFILPQVASDSTSDFLHILSSKDLTNKNDFIELESILPKDAYSRLALAANCLSYELSTTAGLASAEKQDIFQILDEKISPASDIIRANLIPNKITSNLRSGLILPFEIKSQTIDGVTHKSSLDAFIDPVVFSGNLRFSDLEVFSKSVSTNFGDYINLITKVRGIEKEKSISGSELISMACGYIVDGTKTLRTQKPNSKEATQFSYLCEISKNNTINGIKSRYEIFENTFLKNNESTILNLKLQSAMNKAVGSKTVFSKTQDILDAIVSASQQADQAEKKQEKVNKNKILSADNIINAKDSENLTIRRLNKPISPSQRREKNETIKSILGELSMLTGNAAFSMGKSSLYDGQNITTDVFNIEDSKLSSLGTTDSVLGLFGIKLEEIYSKRNSVLFDNSSENPISDITDSGITATQSKKDDVDPHFLSYSSLPVSSRKRKFQSTRQINSFGSKNDNLFTNMGMKTFDSFIEENITAQGSNNRKNLNDRTKNVSSTLIKTNLFSLKKPSGILHSHILGTSLTTSGANEYFKSTSSSRKKSIKTQKTKKDYINSRSIEKIDTIDEVSNLIDSVKLIEKKQFSEFANTRQIDFDVESRKKKTSTLSESPSNSKNIDEKYVNSFHCLLDEVYNDSCDVLYTSHISAIMNNLGKDDTVTAQMNKFYKFLMKKVDTISGQESLIETSGTANYHLDETKIKFLLFQIFNSILSMVESTKASRILNDLLLNNDGYFVSSKINYTKLNLEFDSLSGISNSSGTSSEIVSSYDIGSNFSKVLRAIAYCSISDDLFKERFFVAKSFLDLYTSAVSALTSTSSDQKITESIALIKKSGDISILQNLTKETISAKQLQYTKNFQEPISVRYSSRMCRIYSNILSTLLDKNILSDTNCIAIGIPTTSVETLRRSDSTGYVNFKSEGKEYIEIELSKRNVQFSDLVEKPSKIRFCTSFEVIPQFTNSIDLKSSVNDFTYLCYENGSWGVKSLSESIDFISEMTSLGYVDSISIAMNHIIDAICKISLFGSAGISADEILSQFSNNAISSEGFTLLSSLISAPVISSALPVGDMQFSDFLIRNDDGSYNVKKYSELASAIDKTDQPTHRLLCSLLKDPIFNSELMLKNITKTFAFERIYFTCISKNDFIIDKISSYSTQSGRSTVNGLVRNSMVIENGSEIRFKDSANINRLDSSEISVKLSLVTN